MHREEYIADNMIKVVYAVISASDQQYDGSEFQLTGDQLIVRTLATFVCTHMLHNDLLVKLCRSSCY